MPQRIPSRAENKAIKAALESNFDASPVSPPLSPFINRRPLDSRTEAQLFSACAAIVQGYSGDDDQPPLNFSALHKTAGVQKSHHAPLPAKGRSQSTSYLPATIQAPAVRHSKHASKPDVSYRSLIPESKSAQNLVYTGTSQHHSQPEVASPPQTRPYPPRTSSAVGPTRTLLLDPMPKSPMSRPKTAPVDASDDSYATPKTASTDHHFHYASTGVTSAAITPSHISKHGSIRSSKPFILDNDSYQQAVSDADKDAAAWMKTELERRRKAAQVAEAPQPPPTRSSNRGWTSDFFDKVRPRSSAGSRSASRDSHARKPSESGRSPSAQGWRSWGLNRKSSKSSLIEPRQSIDRVEQPAQETPAPIQRKEIDLNRELPPLPSLDTWQEPEPQPAASPHIASLMQPKSRSRSRKSTARHTMKTIDTRVETFVAEAMPVYKPEVIRNTKTPEPDTEPQELAASPVSMSRMSRMSRLDSAAEHDGSTMARKHSVAHSKTSSGDSCFSPPDSVSPGPRSIDLRAIKDRLKDVEHTTESSSSLPIEYHRRQSDVTTAPTTRPMTRDGKAPNFSRKISIDGQGRVFDTRNTNVVEITALPPMPPKRTTNFAALRKVLSKLELKDKSKPLSNWMDRFEAEGIRGGVMVHSSNTPAPVIRY